MRFRGAQLYLYVQSCWLVGRSVRNIFYLCAVFALSPLPSRDYYGFPCFHLNDIFKSPLQGVPTQLQHKD